MNLSAPFVRRPVATVLLTVGIALAGIAAFFELPVSPLPQVDFPVISVTARLPGASPDTMASSVATPLERRLGTIAGVNEMTSSSGSGQSRVNLQFELTRGIDSAAREVQAAINASRVDLPATLRSNPTYRKANPSDAPVIILALTSDTRTPGQIYDAVSNLVQQKLAQVQGVGDVEIGGGSLPAVRVEVNPLLLNRLAIGMDDVRAAIQATNANRPRGAVEADDSGRRWQIYAAGSDTAGGRNAGDYRRLVVAWRNGAPVRLEDVASVVDGVEDTRTLGLFNGQPAVIVLVTRQPGANVIETVDGVRALVPTLAAQLPPDVRLQVASDSTNSIRSSLREIEATLVIAVILVVAVVGVFLRSTRATLIPAVATVVSLLGTFGVMRLLGFSLNNLSLMALTVATGFVVDDAIVVLENIARHREAMQREALGPEGTADDVSAQAHVGAADAKGAPAPGRSQNIARHREAMQREALGPEGTADDVSAQAHVGAADVKGAPAPGRSQNIARHREAMQREALGPEGTADDVSAQAHVGAADAKGATAPGRSQNTARHIEAGMDRMKAALLGAREVGFTVLSISLSLVAVFIPLLFMGGQVGRLFREFAVTLSVAVLISLVISLTTTPMMCAWLLKAQPPRPGRISRWLEAGYQRIERVYGASLDWALHARALVMLILLAVVGLNVWLFLHVPKGFFPQQDTGQVNGGLRTDQSISFQALQGKLRQIVAIVKRDPAVDTVVAFSGGSRAGGGFMFVNLKPARERDVGGQAVIARLRPQLSRVTGVSVFLNPVQDLRMGGRQSNSTYQYTLKSDNAADLKRWAVRLADSMRAQPELTDVDSDQQDAGVETFVQVDRDSAARLGLTAKDIDNALYNAFGQRQVATIYSELNQYKVILEADQRYARSPESLKDVYVAARQAQAAAAPASSASSSSTSANAGLRDASGGSVISTSPRRMVPLSAIATYADSATPTSVNHQDGELATTISYNLADGTTLSDAQAAVKAAEGAIGLPNNVRGSFQGTAKSFQESQGQQPLLVAAALVVIYIVLGVLYESLIHPLTVLSTLPSAGVGAVLALLLFNMDFSIIALIGVFLLIGIVKKNAILIIDFALEAERARGIGALEAVREACMLRFRPILMTTLAAALGALPLAIGFGEGSELRRPLGVAIIGGLIASQLLTLLTTPVVYVLLDRLRRRGAGERALARGAVQPA